MMSLLEAHLPIKMYYASETDPDCIEMSSNLFPHITHLGGVEGVTRDSVSGGIDLIIGGSPCQGFSFAGKQLNFDDPRSKLFFEFARVLDEFHPKYFLLENVSMLQEHQDIITRYLGVHPKAINSSLVSAQGRKRLYWTNIPILKLPHDRGVQISSVVGEGNIIVHNIYGGFSEKVCRVFDKKSPTIRTPLGGGHIPSVFAGTRGEALKLSLPILRKRVRLLLPYECGQLQTIPVRFLEKMISDNWCDLTLNKMIGNGFTIDVITHILNGIYIAEKGYHEISVEEFFKQ